MYLNKLIIKKFRSINELEIHFNKGLNILIGENSCGKTAIIDALRICLGFGKQWKDIGIRNDEDFYLNTSEINETLEPIEFDLFFKIETDEDRSFFNSMIHQDINDSNIQNIQMHFRYFLETTIKGGKNLRWRSWGGSVEGQQIKPEEAQLIYYTYLAPLRNAEHELRPYAKENKVTSLFKDLTKYYISNGRDEIIEKVLTADHKDELASKLERVIQDENWTGLIKTGEKFINDHLEKSDINNKGSRVHLRLLEYKYENIVKGILTRKPVYKNELLTGENINKQRYFDVSQNGLGENNLIYAASVLGDLKNRREEKKEHYYALLIEEPEAHLHPQRQNTFFNYLNMLNDGLGAQIFITSHSPTITSKSNLNNIIILQKQNCNTFSFTFQNSELNEANKSYLRKFLDVTKSQLFFSNGVLLVEGISEALLLPILARLIDPDFDLDKNGIEIVNIGGVAFDPFIKLFNSSDEKKRLPARCSVLSDDDKALISSFHFKNESEGITLEISKKIFKRLQEMNIIDDCNRIRNFSSSSPIDLESLSPYEYHVKQVLLDRVSKISDRAINIKSKVGGNLKAELAEYTFEYELMCAHEFNINLITNIYKVMHPLTTFLEKNKPIKDRAIDILNKLNSNKDKSALAENLAFFLENRKARIKFKVPDYVNTAITWVIKGE